MAFEGIKAVDITAAHVNALIGLPEGRNLDFKQESYGRTDEEKRKFLADISAFANTIGGHIVIGITEAAGAATGIVGITGDVDAERLRLEGIARTGLQPRLTGLHIVPVTYDAGIVLVIEIPKSWNSPHRITAQGVNRFYLRGGAGNYEPEVDELRLLFTAASTISQKMRDFRHERVAKIMASETPIPVEARPPLILHAFPFSAFSSPTRFSASALSDARMGFMPIVTTGGASFRTNLDGFVIYSAPLPTFAYTMLWKNGCLEATAHNLIYEDRGQLVCPIGIITSISRHGFRYLESLKNLGVEPPIAFFITLTGTMNVRLTMPNQFFNFGNDTTIDRDPLPITEIILEEFPDTQETLQTILKPAYDEIANAGGYEAAPNYDVRGNVLP